MEHKLYFIEGIPGSGKTTRTKSLLELLQQQQQSVVCFHECKKNEMDLARYTILSTDEYKQLCQKIADKEQEDQLPPGRIMRAVDVQTDRMCNEVYIAFQALYDSPETDSIAYALSKRDVYNGHCSFEQFRMAHLKRWKAFAQKAANSDHVYVCDAILFQSPLFELLGYFDMPEDFIYKYISELLACVKDLNPIVYYNRVHDIQKLTRSTCHIRKDDPDKWERGFYKWMEVTPYFQRRNYHGFDGMCAFFKERQEIELALLEKLNIPYVLYNRIC